jgi:SpoVK/Ycf46/Vps4 family AAA+-type ATPase
MGEKHILNLLYHHIDEYEYAATLVEIYEKCIMSGNSDYKFLFYILGHLILNSHECPSIDKNHDLIDMFAAHLPDHEQIICNIFENDKHEFFQKKIFDHAIDESGKADKNAIELHASFKRTYVKSLIVERKHDDIIKNAKIAKKQLFFNPDNKEKIDELTDMLTTKRFNSIKTRLKKAGTRTGFIILFSGYPGTGKTELAMQLAKKTGRDILKVDMSQIRSKWWGEDERNVKGIFSNYKAIMQDSKLEPILLLNEADALIGKRLDVTGNNGAIISSINATQNIILDAFDEFEGICIATTNLTTNFDSAFERRFLYKIEFEKPNNEVRAQILTSMLKIPEDDALILAREFDLSGANIENIYRKMKTKEVLYGTQYNLETLRGLCKDEKIEKERHIGFGHV